MGAPVAAMAFCAAATVVTVSAAATAASTWIVKRMNPPSNRYTCDKPHDTPSPVGHLAGATGLDRAVLSHGSQSLWTPCHCARREVSHDGGGRPSTVVCPPSTDTLGH